MCCVKVFQRQEAAIGARTANGSKVRSADIADQRSEHPVPGLFVGVGRVTFSNLRMFASAINSLDRGGATPPNDPGMLFLHCIICDASVGVLKHVVTTQARSIHFARY